MLGIANRLPKEEGEAIFKRTQQQQLDHMWDQTQP
jgi:hypothetical protein